MQKWCQNDFWNVACSLHCRNHFRHHSWMLKFQLLIPWLHLTNLSVPFQAPIAEVGPSLIKPIQTPNRPAITKPNRKWHTHFLTGLPNPSVCAEPRIASRGTTNVSAWQKTAEYPSTSLFSLEKSCRMCKHILPYSLAAETHVPLSISLRSVFLNGSIK